MNDNDIRTLLSRLDKLEGNIGRLKASNRLLSWALLGLLAMGAFLFILSAAAQPEVQDVVRAKAFEVVGVDGKNLAKLGQLDNHRSGLVLYDASGKVRTGLYTEGDGNPWLTLYGSNTAPMCVLCIGPDGLPILSLSDVSGSLIEMYYANDKNSPRMRLITSKGKLLFHAP